MPDTIVRGGSRFKDSHPHAVERLTVAGVLSESSNVGTILTGEALTNEQLHAWFGAFGYGTPTGLGLPGESPGILADPASWSGSAALHRDVRAGRVRQRRCRSPRSSRPSPTTACAWSPPSSSAPATATATSAPAPRARPSAILTPETAATVRNMLESAVSGENGTGENAIVAGYRVAGKTGTAQRYDEACGGYCGYTSSFVGFAPAEDPEIVVAVIIQDPKTAFFGGSSAAPVFQKIMSTALAAEGVPASTGVHEPFPLTW